MKKRITSIILVVMVLMTATIAFTGCDKSDNANETGWVSASENGYDLSISRWYLEMNKWLGVEVWESSILSKIETEKCLGLFNNNNLPMDTYHMIAFNNNLFDKNIRKIKFDLNVEKDCKFTLHYGQNEKIVNYNLTTGKNTIELIWGDELLREYNEDFCLIRSSKTANEDKGIKWNIKNVEVYIEK